eukprot:CFRG6315T1
MRKREISRKRAGDTTPKPAPKDCFECKVVGTTAMFLSGTYMLYQRQTQFPKNKHVWTAAATAFYLAGLYRAFATPQAMTETPVTESTDNNSK